MIDELNIESRITKKDLKYDDVINEFRRPKAYKSHFYNQKLIFFEIFL